MLSLCLSVSPPYLYFLEGFRVHYSDLQIPKHVITVVPGAGLLCR